MEGLAREAADTLERAAANRERGPHGEVAHGRPPGLVEVVPRAAGHETRGHVRAWQDCTMSGDDGNLTDAWQQLCTRLSTIGSRLDVEPFPATGPNHVRDVRHLARQVVLALQGELEHGN